MQAPDGEEVPVPVADAELAKYWCGTHSENAPRARASLDAIRCKAVLYRSPGSPQPCALAALRLVLPLVLKCRAHTALLHTVDCIRGLLTRGPHSQYGNIGSQVPAVSSVLAL